MPVNPNPPENYTRTCLRWDGGWMEFDAVLRQQIEHDGEVTEHPVDNGADIADHYRQYNAPVMLEALITNSPLRTPRTHTDGVVASYYSEDVEIPAPVAIGPITLPSTVFGFDARARHTVTVATLAHEGLDRVNAVYDELLAIQSEVRLLTVVLGSFRSFDGLVLKSFTIDRERKGELPLSLEFRKLPLVELTTTDSAVVVRKPKKQRSKKASNAGKRAAGAASGQVSLAKRLQSVGF